MLVNYPSADESSPRHSLEFCELASIFAAGILRLKARTALPNTAAETRPEKELSETALTCLEVTAATVLSVHTG